MHIALIPTDGATVVPKQIHDHEIEAHAEQYDVHRCNDDGSTTHVAGPSFVETEAVNEEAEPAPAAKKTAPKRKR